MIAPRWRKVLGDLWSNKARTALVVFSIALGVFAIGMVTGGRVILLRDINNAWEACIPPSASIGANDVDDDLVQTIRRIPGIKEVQPTRSLLVRVRNAAGEWKNLVLRAYDDFDDIRTYRSTPISGQWPPERKAVVLERTTLPWIGVAEGDKIRIEMPDGKQYDLAVTGTVYNMGGPPTKIGDMGLGFISLDTVEVLGLSRGYSGVDILVAENKYDADHVRAIANEVVKKIEKSGRIAGGINVENPGVYPADTVLQAFTFLLLVMGVFCVLLSAFLVINTISALLTQQVKQIGVMKSIGANSGDILQLYLATVLAFGVLAVLIGVPLGTLGAWGLAAYFGYLLNFEVTSIFPSSMVLGLQLVAGLLIPALAALVPIFTGTRISVREAISGYGLGKGRFGKSQIDRLLEKVRFLSRPLLLSLRNTFRRKGRLAVTLTTLTLAGLIFMAVLSEQATMLFAIKDALSIYRYDVEIGLSQPYRTKALDELSRLPGVTGVEYWSSYTGRLLLADDSESNETVSVRALLPDGLSFQPKLVQGRWLLTEDTGAAVVSDAFMIDYPDTKVGDVLRLKVSGKEESVRVVGIIAPGYEPVRLYVNRNSFDPQMGNAGRASTVGLLTERHETALQNQLAEQAKELLKHQGIDVAYTYTETQRVESTSLGTKLLISFLLLMAVLLAVVGGLGLMGTMSINVLERTREIGVLRAIGAGNWAILRLVMVEGILVGLISWVIGAVLSVPFGYLMNKGLEVVLEAQGMFQFIFSYEGMVLWLAIVVSLAALASFLPARKASRMTIRDVLTYE